MTPARGSSVLATAERPRERSLAASRPRDGIRVDHRLALAAVVSLAFGEHLIEGRYAVSLER